MPLSELWADAKRWQQPPRTQWITQPGRQQTGQALIENEPWRGQATRVYALVSLPDRVFNPQFDPAQDAVPGVVCVHGGGGKAFPEWTELWAARGYAAIAMDLGGCGGDGARLPDAMPDQSHEAKFDAMSDGPEQAWAYHAAAAVMRSASLLMSLPQVDASRMSLTGASWGGYLSCVVAGLDDRLACVVPVYGCGYLSELSCWSTSLPDGERADALIGFTPEQWHEWDRHFDPRHFLPGAAMPLLFVNGTNDFAYPVESWDKSALLPPGPVRRSLRPGFAHKHTSSWNTPEVARVIDHVARGKTPPPAIARPTPQAAALTAAINAAAGTTPGLPTLWHADAAEHWYTRAWEAAPATLDGNVIAAPLPVRDAARTIMYFTVTDDDETIWSSPVVTFGPQ